MPTATNLTNSTLVTALGLPETITSDLKTAEGSTYTALHNSVIDAIVNKIAFQKIHAMGSFSNPFKKYDGEPIAWGDTIENVLDRFQGIVIIDEAYSDFAAERPMRVELPIHPNMIILNTMSKAWGCAAIRLGMAFASTEIVGLFNKVKYPYNINQLTQKQALEALKDPFEVEKWVKILLTERARVIAAMKELKITKRIYPTEANFFLVKVTDAQAIYNYLVNLGIIVRNRNRIQLCGNCLRITIG